MFELLGNFIEFLKDISAKILFVVRNTILSLGDLHEFSLLAHLLPPQSFGGHCDHRGVLFHGFYQNSTDLQCK